MRRGLHDVFAVEFHDQAQDAVGGRVLRPHVDDHQIAVIGLDALGVHADAQPGNQWLFRPG